MMLLVDRKGYHVCLLALHLLIQLPWSSWAFTTPVVPTARLLVQPIGRDGLLPTQPSNSNRDWRSGVTKNNPNSNANTHPFHWPLHLVSPTNAADAIPKTGRSQQDEDRSTVVRLIHPTTGQTVTLIGTAHLSKKSNQQVTRLIEQIQPQVVLVELDETRLHRLGIASISDVDPRLEVVTAKDIAEAVIQQSNTGNNPLVSIFLQPLEWITEGFARITRRLLTGMYNDMSTQMKNKDGGGGEFLAAIRAAEQCEACQCLVLGDRDSVTTIRRAAMLALQSGNPLAVLQRLEQVNAEELQGLEDQVRLDLRNQRGMADKDIGEDDLDPGDVQVAMMEALKADSSFLQRLMSKLEIAVPEFTQAFLKERDQIMGEALRRELITKKVDQVVAVVGLAHVPGIEAYLQDSFVNGNNSTLASSYE